MTAATWTAKDVVRRWAAQWDAANPLHKGRTGVFTYFNALFGAVPERTAGRIETQVDW